MSYRFLQLRYTHTRPDIPPSSDTRQPYPNLPGIVHTVDVATSDRQEK